MKNFLFESRSPQNAYVSAKRSYIQNIQISFIFPQVIAHAGDLQSSCAKMNRALREFRVRGVKTNIPFLLNVLENQKFLNGIIDTYFIDEHPQLFQFQPSQNRAQKLLNYLGSVLVNGPSTPLATQLKPADIKPHIPQIALGI